MSARVVVTCTGLHNVYHVLLPPGAAVVDVETRGVTWHQVEQDNGLWEEVYERLGMTPYQQVLLEAGYLAESGTNEWREGWGRVLAGGATGRAGKGTGVGKGRGFGRSVASFASWE